MRLPRLPVSRRRVDELAELVCAYNRIASEDLAEYKRRARKAEARVAELEQTIREHRDRHRGNQWLWSVLDDRQERDDWERKRRNAERVAKGDGATDDTDALQRQIYGREADVRQPRSGRFKRPLDWAARTGGSFKGVRRER